MNLPQLPYIVTDLALQMNRLTGKTDTDYHTMQMFNLLRYSCREDDVFQAEWAGIQVDRSEAANNGYHQNVEGYETQDLAFRMRERAVLFDAAQRNSIIARLPTPKSQFRPRELEARQVAA